MRESDEEQYVAYVAARGVPLRRVAYLLCGDWHRAQDIVQTAIAKLYVHWRKAMRADNLDAYVRQIVIRTFLDEQRLSWFRARRMANPPTDGLRPEAAPAVDDRIDLLDALARIPARQRAVLVLRFWEDLSVAQTADALGCSTGTVKSQTSHGLAAMRKLIPHTPLDSHTPLERTRR